MKIKCPDCSTSYDIKAEALGPEGRSVKCARCGNRWFVAPRPQESEAAPSVDEEEWARDQQEEEEARSASGRDEPEDIDDDEPEEPAAKPAPARDTKKAPPPPDPDEEDAREAAAEAERQKAKSADIESQATRTRIKINPDKFKKDHLGAILGWLMRRNYRRISGVILFVGALGICLFLVLIRDQLVKASPDLASLFQSIGLEVNLRGLEFRDLRTFKEMADGKPALVIEGSVHNIKAETVPVPAVRLSLRDAENQEIYAWTIEPRARTLNALDEARFRTILTEFPSGVTDIQVRFVDRSTAQANR